MIDHAVVASFLEAQCKLKTHGFTVMPTSNSFFIQNDKSMIIADVQTVDGIRAFVQALDYLYTKSSPHV
jgi:hypothetical protein